MGCVAGEQAEVGGLGVGADIEIRQWRALGAGASAVGDKGLGGDETSFAGQGKAHQTEAGEGALHGGGTVVGGGRGEGEG